MVRTGNSCGYFWKIPLCGRAVARYLYPMIPSEIDPVYERIQFLRTELHRHNHRYYVEDRPVLSDEAFDALLRELEDLERAHPQWLDANSPTQRVGGAVTKKFASVRHHVPMQSLANTYSREELDAFFDRVEGALPEEPVRKNVVDSAGEPLTVSMTRLP